MKMGAFEIVDPVPELKQPHAIAMLRPWVDVGSVGTVVLGRLERHFEAKDLAKLAQPGKFFDFTRYRPILRYVNGERRVTVPNTVIRYSKRDTRPDFLFVHLLEPHAFGEEYVDSVLELFESLQVRRYLLIGGMYDVVPHTRPLLVSGSLRIRGGERVSKQFQISRSKYEGPTSILYMVSRRAQEKGIETGNLTVHLPQYIQLEEDLSGAAAVVKVLRSIYKLPERLEDTQKAARQYRELGASVARNPDLKVLVQRLESMYDAKASKKEKQHKPKEEPPLSKEVEQFLLDIDKEFGEN